MTILAAIWARFAGWIGAAGAFIAFVGGVYLKGRREGKEVMREEQERHRREAIANKRKLDDEVDSLGPADLDSRLNKWVHKDGR